MRGEKKKRRPRAVRTQKKPPASWEADGFQKTKKRAGAYFLAAVAPRRNLVVNFSTRPAVSTMRFSPV